MEVFFKKIRLCSQCLVCNFKNYVFIAARSKRSNRVITINFKTFSLMRSLFSDYRSAIPITKQFYEYISCVAMGQTEPSPVLN